MYFMSIECFASIYRNTPCSCSTNGGQEMAVDPQVWRYRQLWATRWVLGTEFQFSARAPAALNHPAISQSRPPSEPDESMFIYLSERVRVCVWCTCGGQRAPWRITSPSILWVLGTKSRLSVLDATALTHWPISQAFALILRLGYIIPVIPGFFLQAFMSHYRLWLSKHVLLCSYSTTPATEAFALSLCYSSIRN